MPNATIKEQLKEKITEGKITFDSDDKRKELLGENSGTTITELAQKLALRLSELTSTYIRISSVIRNSGHHGTGRAIDIGNEEIASHLLPLVATDAKVAELEIDEIIFDAGVAGETNRNKWNYDRGAKHDYDVATLNGHQNHIHFAVK